MRVLVLRSALILTVIALGLFSPACGNGDQQLISIAIQPQNVTFGTFGTQVQFTAIGSYRNPMETKDITSKVVWKSSAPEIITVDATGKATYVDGCAINLQLTASGFSNPQNPPAGTAIIGFTSVNGQDVNFCTTE